jgi:hypothetical protein
MVDGNRFAFSSTIIIIVLLPCAYSSQNHLKTIGVIFLGTALYKEALSGDEDSEIKMSKSFRCNL